MPLPPQDTMAILLDSKTFAVVVGGLISFLLITIKSYWDDFSQKRKAKKDAGLEVRFLLEQAQSKMDRFSSNTTSDNFMISPGKIFSPIILGDMSRLAYTLPKEKRELLISLRTLIESSNNSLGDGGIFGQHKNKLLMYYSAIYKIKICASKYLNPNYEVSSNESEQYGVVMEKIKLSTQIPV
jgi:hypothetical protein